MKKTLFAMMAALSLAACTSDEVMNVAERQAITFDDAFVDNSTRAALDGSYTSANLQEFQVYGTITGGGMGEGTANIFNGERVVRGNSLGMGDTWSYDKNNTQYWIPGNTYNFVAIADGNIPNETKVALDGNEMPTTIEVLAASAQNDILVTEPRNINYEAGNDTKVSFVFNHILSKVKFTFKNTVTTDNGYAYKVSNIAINNAVNNADYNVSTGTWNIKDTHTDYCLLFGNAVEEGTEEGAEAVSIGYDSKAESNFDRLIIPTNESLLITFNYHLLKDGVVIDYQEGVTINTNAIEFEAAHAYNLIVSLGNPGEPITFDVVTVKDWNKGHEDYNPGVNTENK